MPAVKGGREGKDFSESAAGTGLRARAPAACAPSVGNFPRGQKLREKREPQRAP